MSNKTFEDWMKSQYEHNTLADICNHGCAGGFSGLIYYDETTALYSHFKEDIWEIFAEMTDDFGATSILDMLAQYVKQDCESVIVFENNLVWLAAETIAYRLTNGEYIEEDAEVDIDGETDKQNDESSMNAQQLLTSLKEHKGSSEFYRHIINPALVYTEGVQDLAEKADCYWLIDLIATVLLPVALRKAPYHSYCLKLSVGNDAKAKVLIDDGNDNQPIRVKNIDYTDFPAIDEFRLFVAETCIGDSDKQTYCLMLPSEY